MPADFWFPRRGIDVWCRSASPSAQAALVAAALARDVPLVIVGFTVGLIGTLWVTGLVWRDLLMIAATDPRLWIAVCGILGAAGVLASIGPVLRAVRVDPMEVLRAD
jgi:hypothetical protein